MEGRVIDMKEISTKEVQQHELDKSKSYIMVCRSGGRSGQATEYLETQGFNAMNMVGGMLSWQGNVV